MNSSYLLLKSLHVLGVVLFLGNVLVTLWWKVMANRTRQPQIIAFAQRQVTLTDIVFTFAGAALVLLTGLTNAYLSGWTNPVVRWIGWSSALFLLSTLLWVFVLIPLQIHQARLARQFAAGGDIPPRYWRAERVWIGVGVLATVLVLANLYWMVFKPL
ncbi:DUF2269 family protein [Rhodocyclus tenuis]|uniref:DUF2269 family protein n=1 Tax=Rhodocyclus gracilis TaxID=2929842 RepID=UPI001298E6E2|nr:DUF2269 family protein [Rhodocyclus gracilis]MRD73643.1 DUF2269 family protein [Rhodocyclus gracilis]